MKVRTLRIPEARDPIAELRSFAALPPGPNRQALTRAKEIRFHLQGQAWASDWMRAKVADAFRNIEILLSARRWRSAPSIDFVRRAIKGPCSQLTTFLQQRPAARRSA